MTKRILSISVVCRPGRSSDSLFDQLVSQGWGGRGNFCHVSDAGSIEERAERAMHDALALSWTTHHLILRDDAILARGFIKHTLSILKAMPRHVLSLFTERSRSCPRRFERHGWWPADGIDPVAVLAPSEFVRACVAWDSKGAWGTLGEKRLNRWLVRENRWAWHPYQCPVYVHQKQFEYLEEFTPAARRRFAVVPVEAVREARRK